MSMMVYAIGSLKYIVDHKINRDKYKCDPNASMETYTKCVFSRFNQTGCTAIITDIGKKNNDDYYNIYIFLKYIYITISTFTSVLPSSVRC